MRLVEWRRREGLTQDELADQLGCDQSFIARMERAVDPRIPGRDWMLSIWKLTRGAVAPNDFYDLPPVGQLELPIDPEPAPLLDACAAAADEPQLRVAA